MKPKTAARAIATISGMLVMSVHTTAQHAPASGPGRPAGWWPAQAAPERIVTVQRSELPHTPVGGDGPAYWPAEMVLESLAGHAARAVNEGRWNELIWYDIDSPEYAAWKRMACARLKLENGGTAKLWELVRRYHEAGLIEGYVLYRWDASARKVFRAEAGMDESANVATVVAALRHGIVVCEELEEEARSAGLTRLFDARGKDERWCLDTFGAQLSTRYAMVQDPRAPNLRSLVMVQPMMVAFGVDDVTDAAYERLPAPSPILGWNGGDEYTQVEQISRYGHYLVPANWCTNVCVLAAGARSDEPPAPIRAVDPRTIDFGDRRPAVSFVLSDGDNLQWMMGNFFHNPQYWADPLARRGQVDFGVCVASLRQAAPDAYRYMVDTQPDVSIVQMSAGYFYPDRFATKRPEKRHAALVQRAREINAQLRSTRCRVLEFICADWDSPAAVEAYQVFAQQIEDLAGLIVVQYAPYHGGRGEIIWVSGRDGVDVPVLSCKYSLWANLKLDGAGGPTEIAQMIRRDAAAVPEGEAFRAWTVVHAWSAFRRAAGDPAAEHAHEGQDGAARGVTPAVWAAEQLAGHVRVVPVEELLWRLRMERQPEQTRRLIERYGQAER